MPPRPGIALLAATVTAAVAPASAGAAAAGPSARAAGTAVEQYSGKVVTMAHEARGRAAIVRKDGRRLLTLSRGFRVDPGPKVRVYLVAGRVRDDDDVKDTVDLGPLKGSKGSQQYRLPTRHKGKRLNLAKYRTVVFWCVPFTTAMARAELRPS